MGRSPRWWPLLLLAACAGPPRFERPRSLSALPWPADIRGEADVFVLAGALSRVRTGPSGRIRFAPGPDAPPGAIRVNGQTLTAGPAGWSLDGVPVAGRHDSFVVVARDGSSTRIADAPPAGDAPPLPPFRERRVEHGRLAFAQGLARVRVEGNPVQVGRALGELCAPQIRALVREYLPSMVGDDAPAARRAAAEMERHIPAAYVDEMRACAEAAGVAYEDLLLGNVLPELYQLNLCSAVALRGPLTRDGHLIVGRNLDFPGRGMLERCTMLVERVPDEGHAHASVTWPGYLGVLSGMNADGLVAADLLAEYQERSLHGIPYGFLLRRVLERAATVEDALAVVRAADRTVGNSLFFADARDQAAVAEVTARRMLVRRPAADRLFATNLFRSEPNYPYACPRYAALEHAVGDAGRPWDERSVASLLDVADIGWMNIQSMVFVPRARTLWLATGSLPAVKAAFVRVPLFAG